MIQYRNEFNKVVSRISIILFSLYLAFNATISYAEKNSSIDNAVLEVRTQTKGKIISADTVKIDDVLQHRIKVLMPNGHVKVFYKPIIK